MKSQLVISREEINKRAIELVGKKNWEKFDTETQREIFKKLYKTFENESKDIDSIIDELRKLHRRESNLIAPLILGISGALAGNVIFDWLMIYFEKQLGAYSAWGGAGLVAAFISLVYWVTILKQDTAKEILLFNPRLRKFFVKEKDEDDPETQEEQTDAISD